jgi:hypothetical protein
MLLAERNLGGADRFPHSCRARLSLPPLSNLINPQVWNWSKCPIIHPSRPGSRPSSRLLKAIRYWHTRHASLHSTLSTQACRLGGFPSSARSTQSFQIPASTAPKNKEEKTPKVKTGYFTCRLALFHPLIHSLSQLNRKDPVVSNATKPTPSARIAKSFTFPVPTQYPSRSPITALVHFSVRIQAGKLELQH